MAPKRKKTTVADIHPVAEQPKRGRKRLATSQAPKQEAPPANEVILQELRRLSAEVAMLKSQPGPSQPGPSKPSYVLAQPGPSPVLAQQTGLSGTNFDDYI